MVSSSLYPQFETNLMSNRKVIEYLLKLKSTKAHGKNYIKVKPHLVRYLCVIVYWIHKHMNPKLTLCNIYLKQQTACALLTWPKPPLLVEKQSQVYDQNFYGAWGKGGELGQGNSERCVKWGGGGRGHYRIFIKTYQNRGCVKAKVVHKGKGVQKVSLPLLPH